MPEQAFEFMKNMNPQQLVDVFCQTTTGTLKHPLVMLQVIKYSVYANSGLFTRDEAKNISRMTSRLKQKFHIFCFFHRVYD